MGEVISNKKDVNKVEPILKDSLRKYFGFDVFKVVVNHSVTNCLH
jgi:hypothetical protein